MANLTTREIAGQLMQMAEKQPPGAPRIPWGMRTVQRTVEELVERGAISPGRVYDGGPYVFTEDEARLIIDEARVDHRRQALVETPEPS